MSSMSCVFNISLEVMANVLKLSGSSGNVMSTFPICVMCPDIPDITLKPVNPVSRCYDARLESLRVFKKKWKPVLCSSTGNTSERLTHSQSRTGTVTLVGGVRRGTAQ